ncbi:MAG: helix-turn-helix transcriptional regulator [Eubacterium sp.]|nr:helix-turn-helix transcriptional regulator [Eubacterium sp.]
MASKIGNKISELLTERGISQKELSIKANITESAVSHYIKGDRVPRGVNLAKIATALDTTTDYLLGVGETPDKAEDIALAKTLIARNAGDLTESERLELISLLSHKK